MTEEVQALAEADSAQAPEVTATTEQTQDAPAQVEDQQSEQTPEERKFTQAELDAILDKRFAKERRKWEREQQAKASERQAAAKVPQQLPPADQFESPEAYAEALAEKRAQELITQREAAREQAQIMENYHDREEEVRGKYDDFDQVAYNPQLSITDVMAETIRASDMGPELAYHLGSNPKEAERIAKLSPFLQAKEIGRIEAKLAAEPPVKKTSSAPEPIRPVTARATNSGVTDTTDPRSSKTMSDSEWIEADRKRQIAKWQAQRNR
jgi:hypothetical protein